MSNDESPILPCADKSAFDTKIQAEAAALTANWQHDAVLKVYKCKHCHLWHLSTA